MPWTELKTCFLHVQLIFCITEGTPNLSFIPDQTLDYTRMSPCTRIQLLNDAATYHSLMNDSKDARGEKRDESRAADVGYSTMRSGTT